MYRSLTRRRHCMVARLHFLLRALRRQFDSRTPIFFCLNTGRCGSMSIARLLQANGLKNCYHELAPDLHQEGVAYYQRRISAEVLAARLRRTRAGVFFEANNRLFSMAHPLRLAFPQAKFVHLYRDGRDVVRSGLQRRWYRTGDRFGRIRLGCDTVGSPFVKICRYWAEVNQRIMSDLRTMKCGYLPVRFEDLVDGRGIEQLEDFLGVRLFRWHMPTPSNHTPSWSVAEYDQWCPQWRQQFDEICGPVMRLLGYTDSIRGPLREAGPWAQPPNAATPRV